MEPKEEAIALLREAAKKQIENRHVSKPPEGMGDLSCSIAFALAKEHKKNPLDVAKEIAGKIRPGKDSAIEKVEVKGGYINFFFKQALVAEDTISKILGTGKKYGTSGPKNKRVIIEHTSINPNASPHIGRARNAIIGDTLTRLLRANGLNPTVHYFVNDIGKQVSILVWGILDSKQDSLEFKDMLQLYVDANAKLEANPNIEKGVLELQQKFEAGDKKTREIFRKIVGKCVDGQRAILKKLGIDYDKFDYESDFLPDANKLMVRIRQLPQVQLEGKEMHLDLKEFGIDKELVLTREDGTTLYPMRDLAYHIHKMKLADVNYGVYGSEHRLHFDQLKKALELLGEKTDGLVYVFYEHVLLPTGKMSTRKGTVVLLEDFLAEARKRASEEVEKRWHEMDAGQKEEIANAIAVGAVRYSIIRIAPQKTIVFSWEDALSFEGESAPYIQYAHARATRILEKADYKEGAFRATYLKEKEEKDLIDCLGRLPHVVRELKPYLVANYAYELADKFNRFYNARPVIKAGNDETVAARLALVRASQITLENALNLLGIPAPGRM